MNIQTAASPAQAFELGQSKVFNSRLMIESQSGFFAGTGEEIGSIGDLHRAGRPQDVRAPVRRNLA